MSYKSDLIEKDIDEYLNQHENKELLRFTTVGSVDDGKSTLIGRLLYDTGEVYEDQLDAVRNASNKDQEEDGVDLALITDGLKAEREQGITIDVAYRYFTTERRKFIIADTPGHVQYTRNMATGASTADVAIILIDARLGVLEQSRRHAYIASLLKIPNLLVAVNKMDLKDYSQDVFNEIKKEFSSFCSTLDFEEVAFFPVSALKGDNIVNLSDNTPWFKGGSEGKTILEYLETVPLQRDTAENDLCFPVQYVIRPHLNFRGFAGTVAKGSLRKGYEIMVLPSGKRSRIKSIVTFNGELEEASAPLAVTVTLEDEIDISRGDMLVYPDNSMHVSRHLEADLVWMHEEALVTGKQYMVKHATSNVPGIVESVVHRMNMETLAEESGHGLELNDIGKVRLNLSRPLVADSYRNNRQAGAFILIDRMTNATVAAGMISACAVDEQDNSRAMAMEVKASERAQRFGQASCAIWLTGRSGSGKIMLAHALERRLFDAGHMPFVIDPRKAPDASSRASGDELNRVFSYVDVAAQAGLVVIAPFTAPTGDDRVNMRKALADHNLLEVFVDADEASCRSRIEFLGGNPDSASAHYETPQNPDVTIKATADMNINQAVEQIVSAMRERELLS